MLYVIPFIILLIIAVVLKKREASKEEKAPANKAIARNKAKKTTVKNSSRTRTESREVTPTIIAEQKKTTPISQELHQKIISLIQSGNFSSAEAQINQALNRDNSQHGLYLHLLDIHILQKDEFAIDQLITHLRALDLQDIVMQAEAKKRDYEQQKQPDAIEFSSNAFDFKSTASESTTPSSHVSVSEADFDALVQTTQPDADHQVQIDQDTTSAHQIQKQNSVEIEPLEFNFSFDQPAKVSEPSPHTPEVHIENQAPLTEFSLTLEPREVSQSHIETSQAIEIEPSARPYIEATSTELTADFANLEFAPTSEFDLEKTVQPSLDEQVNAATLTEFKFDQLAVETLPADSPIELNPQQRSELSLATASPTTQSTLDVNDPLVQSFPELANINEAQLDLDLASQYIKLGAYDSARILLNKNESAFNAEQRELSKNLLNRIAS
ncbi:hypothetical protein [Acinetobacter ihumii]|uniref:hypothetical protein n=1 Tax=Acinetobacter ihumii TaxID=2483802 RepID=UPI001030F5C1|nr:hypothetical protein [Acinetobacter ihumii]